MTDTFLDAYSENSQKMYSLLNSMRIEERFDSYSAMLSHKKDRVYFIPKMSKWKEIYYRFIFRKKIWQVLDLAMRGKHILEERERAREPKYGMARPITN